MDSCNIHHCKQNGSSIFTIVIDDSKIYTNPDADPLKISPLKGRKTQVDVWGKNSYELSKRHYRQAKGNHLYLLRASNQIDTTIQNTSLCDKMKKITLYPPWLCSPLKGSWDFLYKKGKQRFSITPHLLKVRVGVELMVIGVLQHKPPTRQQQLMLKHESGQ